MAMTQEFYRLGGRLPRYTTKLNSFASGMYLTEQTVPEGFAKVMVNYDIDDTGTAIRPRHGRRVIQTLDKDGYNIGGVHLTDYLYVYKDEGEILDKPKRAEDVEDVVLSAGELVGRNMFTHDLTDAGKYLYYGNGSITVDFNKYRYTGSGEPDTEPDAWEVEVPGPVNTQVRNNSWCLVYDKPMQKFIDVHQVLYRSTAARVVKDAHAFDKQVPLIHRPVMTTMNNELYALTAQGGETISYVATPERRGSSGIGDLELTKLTIKDGRTPEDPDFRSYQLTHHVIEPRVLNPLEASNTGYNVLSKTPYTFENEVGGSLNILGIVMYDSNPLKRTQPIFSPKIGQTVSLGVYYQYPDTVRDIKYKVEVLDLTNDKSNWEVLEDFKNTIPKGEVLYYNYNIKYNVTAVRFTLRSGDDKATETPQTLYINCDSKNYDDIQNQNFDLTTATGMVSWQGCLGLYGVGAAKNTIFFSDYDDPSYFPFPNNIISFDNKILAAYNYLDFLLVVTVDSIWLVTPGTTIGTSVQKRILANIFIPEADALNLQVLKDQIFFKTNDQFYVLKPNQYTSDATDLKNYVNSTAIAALTQDFTANVLKILNKIYIKTWQKYTKIYKAQCRFVDFNVTGITSELRNEEVHYIYRIMPILGYQDVKETFGEVDLHLIYNTLSRSWRLYFVAVGKYMLGSEISHTPKLFQNKQSGRFSEFFVKTDLDTQKSKLYVTEQTPDILTDDIDLNGTPLVTEYNNYPYLDTGNVALEDVNTKRFREVQFNLLNVDRCTMEFYTDFVLDGHERVNATHYELQHITDPQDPDYGTIIINPVEHTNISKTDLYIAPTDYSNLDLHGITDLDEEGGPWAVDLSKFPDLAVTTVRFTLLGRGRRGSLQLLSTSLKRYDLANLNWVYRTMSAR